MNIRNRPYFAVALSPLFSGAVQASEIVYVMDLSGKDHVSAYSEAALAEERAKLDVYATTSKLTVLREGGADEIRIWVSWATFDPDTIGYDTEGYVVSNQGSRICRIAYPGNEHSPASGSCKPKAGTGDAKAILASLGPLSKLSGMSLSCGVVDGKWMSIDGVFAGQRFTFSSSNPGECPGDGSKLVAKVLEDVR